MDLIHHNLLNFFIPTCLTVVKSSSINIKLSYLFRLEIEYEYFKSSIKNDINIANNQYLSFYAFIYFF